MSGERPTTIEVRFTVEPELHGRRVDHFLRAKIRRLSRTKLQHIILTQLTFEDGRAVKVSTPVRAGETILIRRPARPEPICPRTFGVLVDEPSYMVVDKPAGLPMHASARFYFNTLTALLRERFPGQGLQIAHRLDRETSGCIVVARGKPASSKLKTAFAKRKVSKTYLAIVLGEPPWDEEHVIDHPLALADASSSDLKIRMVPARGVEGAQDAVTRVRVLQRVPGGALVECRPITGRQHQIRAHLAAEGFPIVGDKLYGRTDDEFRAWADAAVKGATDADAIASFGFPRQALHAAAITFPHPDTGLPVTVESPLPEDMAAWLVTPKSRATSNG